VLFVGWAAYAVATGIWVAGLLWTVLPAGLTLFLVAERYPWRVVLLVVVPLILLTIVAQLVATWSDAPTWVAFAVYVLACGYFSSVVLVPDRDRWVARLPVWFLGERFAARLAWPRFEESLVAANTMVRQLDGSDAQGDSQVNMVRLAQESRRTARRGGIWRDAWDALAAWLEGLGQVAGTTPSQDQVRHIHDLLVALDRAHMDAVERTGTIDPVG
jgi:hypothetical protein